MRSHFTRLVIERARAIGIAGIVRLSADLVLSIEGAKLAFKKGYVYLRCVPCHLVDFC